MRIGSIALTILLLSGAAHGEDNSPSSTALSVSVKPEKGTIQLGEPMWIRVRATNNGSETIEVQKSFSVTAVGRSLEFTVYVLPAGESQPLQHPDAGPIAGGFLTYEDLPASKSVQRSLLLTRWADIRKPGEYVVKVEGTFVARDRETGTREPPRSWSVPVSQQFRMKVLPSDPEALGKVIAKHGKAVLSARDARTRGEALDILDAHRDARVIPWWMRLAKTGDSALMYAAAVGMRNFESPASLAVLQLLSRTTASAIKHGNTTHTEKAAAAIRSTVAQVLLGYGAKYGDATLEALSGDRDADVRISAARALVGRSSKSATRALARLERDRDARVREIVQQARERPAPTR